jgi:site-specific DNA-methyltransferase (adenine-specific)
VSVRILQGDCRERMRDLDEASIDSCVTDPPYHLTSIVKRFGAANAAPAKVGKTGAYARASKGFMGQQWDGGDVAFQPETWAEVLRVLKPGAHLVAFSGTRTYHRMACAIEDAGFEIRDQLAWVYGSGFPKSHNQPGGWGTALKPAWEPICLARKPLVGTVAGNMAAHGTGALNIDGCRIETEENLSGGAYSSGGSERHDGDERWRYKNGGAEYVQPLGRWPANIIHDGSEEVLAAFPDAPGQMADASQAADERKTQNVYGAMKRGRGGEASADRRYADEGGTNFAMMPGARRGDSGSAARFFYCAKATSDERGDGNNHPTVKPVDLMRWLCRLVTPKGGTILDPFAGSGSTLIAADAEQFHAIGCELSLDYAAIAERRVRAAAGMFAEVMAA